MNRLQIAVCTGLLLLPAMALPVYAQQEQRDQDKAQQEQPKAEPKPAEPNRNAPAERKEEARPQEQRQDQRQEQDRRMQQGQENRERNDQDRNRQQQQDRDRGQMQNQERHEQQQQAEHHDQGRPAGGGERRHVRIPDDRFRSTFGREHHFRIESRPVIVEGVPRFQYSGYWFEMAQPWPGDWTYTDDFYVDYIDGDYYMFDPRFPDMRILVYVIEGY